MAGQAAGGNTADAPVSVLIVDDHPVVRDGLRAMLGSVDGIVVVGAAADGREAVRRVAELAPDVVLMDLRMPKMGGVEAIAEIVAAGASSRVLVLTTFDADSDVLPAIQAGAAGYLLKDAPADDLVRAIHAAQRGEPVLSPTVAGRLMSRFAGPASPATAGLSLREIEVLSAMAAGATNRAIATALFVSETTVKTHLVHIYDKLGVHDRAAAVDAAHRLGLLS